MAISITNQRKQKITNVVKEYGTRLFRFIRAKVSSKSDAEDVLQDVWYQFSKIVDIDTVGQVSGWLFRVARNRITDLFRKKRPLLLEDFSYDDKDGNSLFKDKLLIDTNTPETEVLRNIFWKKLYIALDELPKKQREVFIWNELEDKTFREISERTGDNIKTLISRKRYAVQHLRKHLGVLYKEFLYSS